MLQRLSEDLEYHELLDKASKCQSSLEQMCYVAAFSVSSYSTTVYRTGKPFNPLLGETYELDRRRESGYRSLCEQVGERNTKSRRSAKGKRNWTKRGRQEGWLKDFNQLSIFTAFCFPSFSNELKAAHVKGNFTRHINRINRLDLNDCSWSCEYYYVLDETNSIFWGWKICREVVVTKKHESISTPISNVVNCAFRQQIQWSVGKAVLRIRALRLVQFGH